MKFKGLYAFLALISLLLGCESNSKLEKEISKITVQPSFERFDQQFPRLNDDKLKALKTSYPFLFSTKYDDAFWIKKSNDSLEIRLANEVNKTFNQTEVWKTDVINLFKHLKYYYPNFKSPRVISLVSGVDYRNKTIVTDSIVLLALDNYLGADHEFYQNISAYISSSMQKEFVVSDLASSYAKKYTSQPRTKTFLEEMIYRGKLLAFKDKMIPFTADSLKIKYSEEQLNWAVQNESQVWRYFIDKQLLFSSDPSLLPRFINPAPFSKFYLDLDNTSPGRIGEFIGWQIVKSFLEKNNEVTFQNFLAMNAEEIYNKSGYKPKR